MRNKGFLESGVEMDSILKEDEDIIVLGVIHMLRNANNGFHRHSEWWEIFRGVSRVCMN
jgi:hypothetical protein